MPWFKLAGVVLCAIVFVNWIPPGAAPPRAGLRPEAELEEASPLKDVLGRPFRLAGGPDCQALVLLFLGHDCPISNGYAPELARLHRDYAARGVEFVATYADADVTADEARRHATEYRLPFRILFDPDLTLARCYGATVKPEAVVLSPRREMLYRGRIDDRYFDFGKRREKPAHTELRDALEAVLAGRPVPAPRTPALGCDIDFPKP